MTQSIDPAQQQNGSSDHNGSSCTAAAGTHGDAGGAETTTLQGQSSAPADGELHVVGLSLDPVRPAHNLGLGLGPSQTPTSGRGDS